MQRLRKTGLTDAGLTLRVMNYGGPHRLFRLLLAALLLLGNCAPLLADTAPSGWDEGDQERSIIEQPDISVPSLLQPATDDLPPADIEPIRTLYPASAHRLPRPVHSDEDIQAAPVAPKKSSSMGPGSWLGNKMYDVVGGTAGAMTHAVKSTAKAAENAAAKSEEGITSPTGQKVMGAALVAGALVGTGALLWYMAKKGGFNSGPYYGNGVPYYGMGTNPCVHWVNPYFRSDGVYVTGHWQTCADATMYNNFSSMPNINPFTGRRGTIFPTY